MTSSEVPSYQAHYLMDVDEAPGGVLAYYADGDEEIIYANAYLLSLCECATFDEFLQLTRGSFHGLVHENDVSITENSIWRQVDSRGNLDHVYYRIRTKSGRTVNVDDYGRLVRNEGERPFFNVFVIEVGKRDTVDWLTGLPSSARFSDTVEDEVAYAFERGVCPAVVSFDLIGMKFYNSKHGRAAGDQLLCVFAEVLKRYFGSEGCSRFEADHFFAVEVEGQVEQKVKDVFADFEAETRDRTLPVRAGLYEFEDEHDPVFGALERASYACDADRVTYQSRYTWFSDEMRAAAHMRMHVLDHIDQAIAEGWVRPFYQAVVRAATGEICGEEALARWFDPERGVLPPASFVPVLEEAGLLHKLDMHILECVLADMETKRVRGVPLVPVSVNISLRDMGQLEVAQEIIERTDAAGISHDLLHIEFTESAASSDPELFKRQVSILREAGFAVWMDDFGSGYSSLYLLQEFSFDLIKLDMGLINGSNAHKSREIVAGIIHTAERMKIATLAEGVETEEQASFLEEVGCELLQGYYYARPASLDDVIAYATSEDARPRERLADRPYWNAVSSLSLTDPTANEDIENFDGVSLATFPMAVHECREGVWSILRLNRSYRTFLESAELIPRNVSGLEPLVLPEGPGANFEKTARDSLALGEWERVIGRHSHDRGYQFYIRPVASLPGTDAFLSMAIPTMLGSALGSYGDVPVAYAVFRAILNEAGDACVDAEYVYANKLYCEWGEYGDVELAGHTFSELNVVDMPVWASYCYRAAVLHENVHDVVYSPAIGHWINFYMAPSPIEGCCVYACALVDDEKRAQDEVLADRDTADLIIEIAEELNREVDYEASIYGVLESIGRATGSERVFVFEREEQGFESTFEWFSPRSSSQMSLTQSLPTSELEMVEDLLGGELSMLVTDISQLEARNELLWRNLVRRGVTSFLAAPFFHDGRVAGYLAVENFEREVGLDSRRLVEAVAPFVGVRIYNRRYVSQLEWSGTHDELTGMLNRRGIDLAIAERMSRHPEKAFALALMGVRGIKDLNDRYGHEVGDKALKALADAINRVLPHDAVVGRNAGNEFLAMLFGDDVLQADELLKQLAQQDLSVVADGRSHEVRLYVGYVVCPGQTELLRQAYTHAGEALREVMDERDQDVRTHRFGSA